MTDENETLSFIITPRAPTRACGALKRLKNYARSLNIHVLDSNVFKLLDTFVVLLRKEDAERLFGVEVEWTTFTVPNLNTGSRKESDWRVITRPQIPEGLGDCIQYITFDQAIFLTD